MILICTSLSSSNSVLQCAFCVNVKHYNFRLFFLGREQTQILWKRVSNIHLNVVYPQMLVDNIYRKGWKCLLWAHCSLSLFCKEGHGPDTPVLPFTGSFPSQQVALQYFALVAAQLSLCGTMARSGVAFWWANHEKSVLQCRTAFASQPCCFCQATPYAFATRDLAPFPCTVSCVSIRLLLQHFCLPKIAGAFSDGYKYYWVIP